MCAPGPSFDLEEEALDGGRQHKIGHRDKKRNASYSGDIRDLNQGDVLVESDTKAVPAECRKNDSPKPLESDPACGAKDANTQIM